MGHVACSGSTNWWGGATGGRQTFIYIYIDRLEQKHCVGPNLLLGDFLKKTILYN